MSVKAMFKNPPIKVTGSLPADTWTTKAKCDGLSGNPTAFAMEINMSESIHSLVQSRG